MDATPSTGPALTDKSFSRRSLLLAGSAAAALLTSLQAAPSKAAANDDPFTVARQAWKAGIVGSGYNPSDPPIASRLASVASTATKWQSSMITGTPRTSLWADLPLGAKSANVTSHARRLRDMAIGWAAEGSPAYRSSGLRAAIIDGLDWFTSHAYTANSAPYDNWYEWMIATPQALNDTAVLMFEQLAPAQITACVAAQEKQVPEMPTTGTKAAAANLALIADGFSGRGVLAGELDTVKAALASLASILSYAQPVGGTVGLLNGGNVGAINGGPDEAAFFSHDGFYPDGSFIQHGQFPYVGGYGSSFLSSLVATITRTAALGTPIDTSIVYTWIHEAFEPFLWNGLVMDTIRGRNVAFSAGGDHDSGHGILAACLPLLASASGAERQRLASMLKQELTADTAHDPTSAFSLASLAGARTLLADTSVSTRGPLVKTQVFGAMDRVLHRTESYAAAVAMHSLRISNYETGNNENLAGWYTADGALYLYTNDLDQFDNGYWYTVDPYRIPGTTVDRVERTYANVPWRAEYHNPDYWAGGVTAGTWGAAAFRLKAEQPSSLRCRKSWFFFGEQVLCLGDGISAAAGRTVETVLENRRSTSVASAGVTVDGRAVAAVEGTTEAVPAARWAHLEGVAGYVFPTPTDVHALRQNRTGKLADISPNRSSPAASNTFSTLWLDHTESGSDSYAYLVLPGASASATAHVAEQSSVRVIARTGVVHAARHESAGRWAAAFFDAGTASFVTASQACAVAVEELADQLVVTLSDPTQLSSSIVLELDIKPSAVLSADPGVDVSRQNGRTRITADVNGTLGSSKSVRLRYVLTPELVSERLKDMNKAGLLGKEPYKQLDEVLARIITPTRTSTGASFLTTLEGLKAVIDTATYTELEDLGSRLLARLS
ncbi:hyaluronate lyase [Paenarthrobacter nicotinovorans]|uniref:polysaccharide lyase 8 family protein n=1 Tax=Paenarthrobacter nicotinovorans TaxID=29320 RepID=UPI002789E405|nr:polysaccharide lyase 8 family protein [Paenarthrobacter nicotinovorans]MDP9933975.1 hyaluronate lyase [Paenarthrobacter nicotinovorans]